MLEEPVVRVENLWFRYEREWVLRRVNLEVYSGEMLALIGRNGSGKSTLLKLIAGLLKPVKGRVTVAGVDTKRFKASKLARLASYMHQEPTQQLFALSVREEIRLGLRFMGLSEGEIETRLSRIVRELALEEVLDLNPRFLSRGDKQKVVLASLLVREPKVLLLDEPTTGLDSKTCDEVMRVVKSRVRRGCAAVIATHDLRNVAKYSDRVAVLHKGSVIATGSTTEILGNVDLMRSVGLSPLPLALVACKLDLRPVLDAASLAEATFKKVNCSEC